MPRLHSFVLAGVVTAVTLSAASTASAGRQVHGGDVARVLTGRAFQIECVDGTRGYGQFTMQGVAMVSYRRSPSDREERDRAQVKVRGVEICLAWKQFGGGGDGCYPVLEQAAGHYRLSAGPLWCDISNIGNATSK